MKKRDVIRLSGALLLILVTAFPGAASADPIIAEVENLGDTLVFHPVTEFAQLVLTVTGPCDFQYRQVVTKGEPIFRLDQTTIDGRYTYNLVREEPIDPAIIKVLQAARKNFDEEAPKALCREGRLPGPPIAQSEGFGVVRGEIVYDPATVEKAGGDLDLDVDQLSAIASEIGMSKEPRRAGPGLTTKDFVINDDLIVDGSACIGFDCVNGESFGFDTIRLKENNLRIKFDDTSTAASFPRNDWQLTANDSANGGASKFSIDDISNARTPFTVEANARSHSLYVDDGGRIGSRTSTPSVEIHTIDGDTPTLRLQQDGSSGFAPQTWDVAGNETNFFVRDVTNGSALPFRIRPGAPSSSIFIDVDGDVGIGTSSPEAKFHINSTAAANFQLTSPNLGILLEESDTTDIVQQFFNNSLYRIRGLNSALTETATGISMEVNGNTVGINCNDAGDAGTGAQLIVGDGGTCASGAFSAIIAGNGTINTSSRTLKENLRSVADNDILQKIAGVDVYTYDFINGPKDIMGLMAEDFHKIFGRGSEKMINDREVQMALWLAVQQLTGQVKELEAQLAAQATAADAGQP